MSSKKDEMIKKYQNILPPLLLSSWEKYGFGAFENGLYWLVNPQEYKGLLEAYTKGTILQDHPGLHVIARSAFGCSKYDYKKAAVVCAEGSNDVHGSHGAAHASMSRESKKAMDKVTEKLSYEDARNAAVKSHI